MCIQRVYTTAHVNCLNERKDSRLIGAFFQVCRELLKPAPGSKDIHLDDS